LLAKWEMLLRFENNRVYVVVFSNEAALP
jgi:hypothetical protein